MLAWTSSQRQEDCFLSELHLQALSDPRAAKGTGQKDKIINIRLSSDDLQVIRTQALQAGIPYQSLISSVLPQYVNRSRLYPLE